MEDVRTERGQDVILMLVGNKSDVESREVSTSEGSDFATQENVMFVETSAKVRRQTHDERNQEYPFGTLIPHHPP